MRPTSSGVVHADFHLQQLPARRRHQAELPAAVGRRQPAVVFAGEPEVLVVAADGLDVWYFPTVSEFQVCEETLNSPFTSFQVILRDVPRNLPRNVFAGGGPTPEIQGLQKRRRARGNASVDRGVADGRNGVPGEDDCRQGLAEGSPTAAR